MSMTKLAKYLDGDGVTYDESAARIEHIAFRTVTVTYPLFLEYLGYPKSAAKLREYKKDKESLLDIAETYNTYVWRPMPYSASIGAIKASGLLISRIAAQLATRMNKEDLGESVVGLIKCAILLDSKLTAKVNGSVKETLEQAKVL